MYIPYQCDTESSFDVQIVKIGWYIHWPSKTGEFKMVHVGPIGLFCGCDFLKER